MDYRKQPKNISENIRYLVVHHSQTSDDDDKSAEDLHEMHLNNGWLGIGYHPVIQRNGKIQQGRKDHGVGAYVKSYNEISLGVCLIGTDIFTDEQMNALETLLREWKQQYPMAKICGHCDLDNTKKCPNFDVGKWCTKRGLQ